jgi:hypothetical protein
LIVHRLIISLFLLGVTQIQAATSVHDVHVQVQPSGEQFQVVADFKVGLSLCQAVTFIRDYEAAKNFPGIKESKIISRTGNQVLVERVVEEQILFVPVTMQSVVQYKEVSDQLLEFRQISGDAKYYQGVWRLIPEGNGIRFQYLANIELSSIVPHSIAEYFIKNQMTKRFEAMAENATQRMNQKQLACR